MDRFFRLRLIFVLAAVLPFSGCLFRSQREVPMRISTAALKDATLDQLIQTINSSADRLQTLNARVDIDASSGGEKKGKVTDYRQVSGYLLVRKPEMLRLIGLVPVVRNTLFDMASDGSRFQLSIPPLSKFYVGSNGVATKPSSQPLENLRPQQIFDALLLKKIDPQTELAVMEQNQETVKDPKTHKNAIQPDYAVVVIRKDDKGYYLSRRIVFSRTDLLPHEQYIYNRNGQLATFARYENFGDHGGIMFPGSIEIQRPIEETAITLTVQKLTLNEPLKDDQFVLVQPPGSKLINLDSQTTNAGNQSLNGKPQ